MNLKLYEAYKINIPSKYFNLQLFLTLELFQIQEILSIFQELLFLYVKYNLIAYGGTSNAYGLITESSTTAGGKTLVTSYTYDRGLRVSEIAYPDSRIVNYTYSSTGFLKSAGSGKKSDGNTTAYAKDGTYNTAGQLMSLTAGNGKTTTRTWNIKEGTLSSYSWGLSEYSVRALTWDVRGNITSIEKGRADSP